MPICRVQFQYPLGHHQRATRIIVESCSKLRFARRSRHYFASGEKGVQTLSHSDLSKFLINRSRGAKSNLLLVKMKEKKLLKMQSLPKVLRSQAMRSTT
jgi:hypothetical protein